MSLPIDSADSVTEELVFDWKACVVINFHIWFETGSRKFRSVSFAGKGCKEGKQANEFLAIEVHVLKKGITSSLSC